VPFVDGFLLNNPSPKDKWGHFARLAGVAQHVDGSLLLSDDTNNIVYRIAYGKQNTPRPMATGIDSRLLAREIFKAPNTIKVTSRKFKNNAPIPTSSTAFDKNISPDLWWTGAPKGTKSIAILMEDPDSRSPKPFIHWIAANISPTVKGMKAGLPNDEILASIGAVQGSGSTSKTGYYGPKTPAADGKHHYNFQVFALDKKLNLPSGYNRLALIDAMAGHVLAKGTLVGTYDRNPY